MPPMSKVDLFAAFRRIRYVAAQGRRRVLQRRRRRSAARLPPHRHGPYNEESVGRAYATPALRATWRGWMPLPDDDGGGGEDEEPEPEPLPGGPWTRAHQFNLLR